MERIRRRSNKWWIGAVVLLLCAVLIVGVSLLTNERAMADDLENVDQKLSVSIMSGEGETRHIANEVHRGEEFDVDISISNNAAGMHALRLLVRYDRSAMELVRFESKVLTEGVGAEQSGDWKGNFIAAGEDYSASGYATYGTQKKPFVLMWESTDKLYGNGTIVTLTFASKKDAPIDPVTKDKVYAVSVEVDADNTMMSYGRNCSPSVTGGEFTMTYGYNRIVLLDASLDYDDPYCEYDANSPISIEDVLELRDGELPAKDADEKYTYEFVSWREVKTERDGNWLTYKPVYRAVPKDFTITFKQGIQVGAAISYTAEEIDTYLGEYDYRNAEVTLPYGTVILFDNYKPTVDYARHPGYTFRGWYCLKADGDETVVADMKDLSFVTMPSQDVTLYGYYILTEDPDDVTTTKLKMTSEIDGDVITATLSVEENENFGFNTLRFALDYADALEFLGFRHLTGTGSLASEFTATYPEINDAIKAGTAAAGTWQMLDGEHYTLADKYFLFESVRTNSVETGDLISFKFRLKATAGTCTATIGITIGERDLTRYEADGSTWYANAVMTNAAPEVIRVVKPTANAQAPYYTITYDGASHSYAFGSEEESSKEYYDLHNASRKEAGEYIVQTADDEAAFAAVRVSLKDMGENTIITWADGTTADLYFGFVIDPRTITKPAENTTTFVYNKETQTYTVAASDDYSVVDNSNQRKDAGSYKVVIRLADAKNTAWADGTQTDLEYDFVINRKEVTKPTETADTYTFDNNEHTYTFQSHGDEDWADWYTVSGDKKTAAGEYTVTVALRENTELVKNVVWKGETEEVKKTADLTFAFNIGKKQVKMPTPSKATYVYDYGKNVEYKFDDYGDSTDYDYYNYIRQDAGNYNVKTEDEMEAVRVELKDTVNTVWKDAEEGKETAILYFPFVIQKVVLVIPKVNSKAYNGYPLKADVSFLTDEDAYTCIENNGGTEKKKYDVKFEIKDSKNFRWADSEDEEVVVDGAVVTVPFRITESANSWTVPPYVVSKLYDGQAITTSNVTAAFDTEHLTISYYLRDDVNRENKLEGAPKNAGRYSVYFEVPGSESESYDAMSTKIDFEITKVKLTAPTETVKSYVYNGKHQDYEFANKGDTEKYSVTYYRGGVACEKCIDAGNYTVHVSIIDKTNYSWKDDTVKDIDFSFTIAKATVEMPTPTAKQYVYTGSEQSYEFATVGDALQYEVKNASRTIAGTQIVEVKLKDDGNYQWKDAAAGKETATLEFTFTIAKMALTIPTADETQVYIYNGEKQLFVFAAAGDTDRYTVKYYLGENEVSDCIDAGNYTVVATVGDPINYEFADGTSEQRYPFPIKNASISASTTGEDVYTVTINSRAGFVAGSHLSVGKALPDPISDFLTYIAGCEKVGFGDLSDEEAAAMIADKCLAILLNIEIDVDTATGEYRYEITLPAARTGIVVARIVGQKVEVFEAEITDQTKITFVADSIMNIAVLADHIFFEDDHPSDTYLRTPKNCIEPATYYTHCACGLSSEGRDEEAWYSFGEAEGHDYDFDNIEWIWRADHRAVKARVVCKRHCGLEGEIYEVDIVPTITDQLAPTKTEDGYVYRVASFVYDGRTYTSPRDVEILEKDGHTYTADPVFVWTRGTDTYTAKAYFTCECGESTLVEDATVSYVIIAAEKKVVYTAEVIFNGEIRRETKEETPIVIFDFNDRRTSEASYMFLPGTEVDFTRPQAILDGVIASRTDYTFTGWRDENGTLIIATEEGYLSYRMGFDVVTFTAEWRSSAQVDVSIVDADGNPVQNAKVSIYDGEDSVAVATAYSAVNGSVSFEKVPYGNYKLVAEYAIGEGNAIIRTTTLDVDEAVVNVRITLPATRFDTKLEGDGSAEGLEGAISEEEKDQIGKPTETGTVTKVVITQKRVQDVSKSVKDEIVSKVKIDAVSGNVCDYYDVTIVKETTITSGETTEVHYDDIKVADSYQTNIFPVSKALRAAIANFGGTVDNIFVYKRHMYETGTVRIDALPKVSEREGATADYECYYVKKVAGEEYIAIHQKEYSVLALGVSPDPVLLDNEITKFEVQDLVYTGASVKPKIDIEARYMGDPVYSYSTTKDGEYVSTPPTAAGTYYVKARIAADETHSAAESTTTFTILKKVVTRPAKDETVYTYNGEEQTYLIAENAAYTVTGNVQTNAGKYVVTVALADPANTVWDSGLGDALSYDFSIEKKKLTELEGITFRNKSFWFNGKKHSIKISGELPEGVDVVYSGNGESDLGKFVVTATFVVSNENYDASEPLTAVMKIRLNWVPIVILIVIVLLLLILVIVIVERMLRKLKKDGTPPPEDEEGSDDDAAAAEEDVNND